VVGDAQLDEGVRELEVPAADEAEDVPRADLREDGGYGLGARHAA
jgi:hypothetical protein